MSTPLEQDFYSVLARITRAILNGHPVGHDAVMSARRVLKIANGGKLPDLSCNCTPCAIRRRTALEKGEQSMERGRSE